MLQVRLRDGEAAPPCYRIAWYDYRIRRAVCYPVGIHWIAWAVRWLWTWTYKQPRPDAWERACAEIRAQARDEARVQRLADEDKWIREVTRLERENAELREAIRQIVPAELFSGLCNFASHGTDYAEFQRNLMLLEDDSQ